MEEENGPLMELPKVNLEGVLTRLSLQSLLVCCCVSKSLLNLIENDTDFAKQHFATSEPHLMILSPETTSCHLIDLDADTTPAIGARVEIKPNFNLPVHGFEVTDSCNGLVLLESMNLADGSHRCIVWNPVTGEYIMLPETKRLTRYASCALFYCPKTNQFKIFRAFHLVFRLGDHHLDSGSDDSVDLDPDLNTLDPSSDPGLGSDSAVELNHFSEYDIDLDSYARTRDSSPSSDSDSDSDSDSAYSESDVMGELLVGGSDSWDSLGNLPFSPLTIYSPCYLDKATHWLCLEKSVPNYIVFFNFESHQFGEIPTPAHMGKSFSSAYWLVALGGFLSIFDSFTVKDKFDIWVMKEYGSWTKDFVIDMNVWGSLHRDLFSYEPVICRRNGEVVMICEEGFILFYDLLKKSGRIIEHRPLEFPVRSVVHTPSIVSLRDAVRDSNMTVLNVPLRFGQPELSPHFYLELLETFSE